MVCGVGPHYDNRGPKQVLIGGCGFGRMAVQHQEWPVSAGPATWPGAIGQGAQMRLTQRKAARCAEREEPSPSERTPPAGNGVPDLMHTQVGRFVFGGAPDADQIPIRIDEYRTSTNEQPATICRGEPPPLEQQRDLVVSRDLPQAGRDRRTGPHEPADEVCPGGEAEAGPGCCRHVESTPSRLRTMPVHHFTCDGRYVRLLLRRGRKPVAYHPDSR